MVGTAERWGRLSSTMPSTICGPVLPAFGQGGDYPEGGAVGEFRAACSPFLWGRRVTGSRASLCCSPRQGPRQGILSSADPAPGPSCLSGSVGWGVRNGKVREAGGASQRWSRGRDRSRGFRILDREAGVFGLLGSEVSGVTCSGLLRRTSPVFVNTDSPF
jgi:hypothetical protein